jgi:hypothetical protein
VRTRALLVGVGVVTGLYGAWLLLSREGSTTGLVDVAKWLVVGVVLHDFVLVPLTLGVFFVGRRLLPQSAIRPVTFGLVVLGTATILAIPVLTGFGRRADNPTLDDRHYWIGWFVLAGLVLAGVLAHILAARRRR